jgi:hypothetical protein
MDDFLLLTTCKKSAETFVELMAGGFPELGLMVNTEKSQANFHMCIVQHESPNKAHIPLTASTANDSCNVTGSSYFSSSSSDNSSCYSENLLQWNGLLLDADDLSVRVDYGKIVGEEVADVLTISTNSTPGQTLKRAFNRWLQPKAHPLLLDASFNPPHVIALSIYDIFYLAASKLIAYHRDSNFNSNRVHAKHQHGFLLNLVKSGIDYFIQMVNTRFAVAKKHIQETETETSTLSSSSMSHHDKKKQEATYGLNKWQTRYVALSAYKKAFEKCRMTYKVIIEYIDREFSILDATTSKSTGTNSRQLLDCIEYLKYINCKCKRQ